MERVPALRFAATARSLAVAARAAGLSVPAFRSPPRVAGVSRTIRRYPGGAVVSVRLRGRTPHAVLADMVDGVLAANGLSGPTAARMREALLHATGRSLQAPARVAERQTQAA